jgi:DNA adenine methylase
VAIQEISSFLKWAGGKRWLVKRHSYLFPEAFDRYFEPFVGSGAVFFALRPRYGLISDSNSELINLYETIKTAPEDLMRALKRHSVNHSERYYYETRECRPKSSVQRAARTLYLNRTCWNGLYRVNKLGQFNVPRGTKNSVILPSDDFLVVSKALRHIRIRCCDFEETISQTKEGDFLFVDPPYTVRHNNNGFLKYNDSIFTWNDQIRLSRALECARRRGVKMLVTNADHKPIRVLYNGMGAVHTLPRESVISGAVAGRRRTSELAVQINYEND